MKCDKCEGLIDERDGYVTIESSIIAKHSERDAQGRLITTPILPNMNKVERTCWLCVRELNVDRFDAHKAIVVKDSQPKGLTVEKIQSCVYDWLYNPEIDVWNKNDHKKLVQTIHAAQEGKGKK